MVKGGNFLFYKNPNDEEKIRNFDKKSYNTKKDQKDSKIQFSSIKRSKTFRRYKNEQWIIVGVDPGLTVGIAIIDLDGNLISIKSCKEISKADIINHIIRHGKAILVASDVYPPPKMIKKLASALNARISSPDRLMSVTSKIEIVESYINERSVHQYPENAHERDALAAAVKTYKNYQNKFSLIEKRAEKLDLTRNDIEKIRIKVIKGRAISSAINDVLKNKETSKLGLKTKNEMGNDEKGKFIDENSKNKKNREYLNDDLKDEIISKQKEKIKKQEKQIKNLIHNNAVLKENIEKYQDEISKLNIKIDKLHYEYSKDILYKKEISSKIAIIKGLQEKYTQEKALRRKLEENLKSIKNIRVMELSKKAIPVKIIESFTREEIKAAHEYWNIKKGDVVLLLSSKGGGSQTAALLIEMSVKAIITMDTMSHQARYEFEKSMVPILEAKKINFKIVDEFAIIKEQDLKKEIKKWKKDVKDKRKKEEEKKLIKVIDEYRAQRKRSS